VNKESIARVGLQSQRIIIINNGTRGGRTGRVKAYILLLLGSCVDHKSERVQVITLFFLQTNEVEVGR
jgi:hypothetical protein